MKIIGLDVGEKRIGVAKVDTSVKISVPVGTFNVDGSEWGKLAKLCELNNTNIFVLGLPRSNEGNETAQSMYVRNFAKTLAEKIPGARIRFQDESLTSVVAEERLKKRKGRYEKWEIDAEAATIILQDFVENFNADTLRAARAESKQAEPANEAERIQQEIVAKTKKESDKIKLKSKKAVSKVKKWTVFGIPIIVIVILLGVTAVLKVRDYIRWQREEENARIEAEMHAKIFQFTILPGETIFDIKRHLLEVDRNGGDTEGEMFKNYTLAEVEKAFNTTYDFAFLADRPVGATLEGYLFGETHEFYADSSVEDVITKFLEGTEKVINENDLINAYAGRGLSLFEGITLASVVQKEAPALEMPTVAQVFLTRLSSGIPLGSDVTVSYALDVVDPDREKYTDNQSALTVDSCYNTRIYGGLPCGPISNPGISALLAVANPTGTAYLYFLTGDDGVMYYSYTEAEHNQNIYLHCQTLCDISL